MKNPGEGGTPANRWFRISGSARPMRHVAPLSPVDCAYFPSPRGCPPRSDESVQTRSAIFVPMRWKRKSPAISTTATPTADAAIAAPGGCPCPVNAQRNPSMTPAIGFRPYSQRHFAGTSELGYATGDASIQNCTTNGITARTSRYKAFSAEVHSPTPSAVSTASTIITGSSSTVAGGWIPNDSVSTTITNRPLAKSTNPENTAAIGRISRGKYTFVITFWLSTTMFVQAVSACEKYAQGTSAAK